MATVYRALRDDGQEVAIKVMDRDNATEHQVTRFERECRIGGMLNHEAIVNTYESGSDGSLLYMIQDYVPNGDVKAKIGGERIPWRKAVRWAALLAEGLAHSHSQGVIHRDIKPANILLDKTMNPRISDFGLAIIHGEGPNVEETARSGFRIIVGTPLYMPPEQFKFPNGVDARADIYALGVTLFEMLANRRPLEEESVEKFMDAHETQAKPMVSEFAEVPEILAKLIDRMIAKKASWRYEQMLTVAKDLRAVLDGNLTELTTEQAPSKKASARMMPVMTGLDDAPPAPPRSNIQSILWIILALVLVLALGVGVWLFQALSLRRARYETYLKQAGVALQGKEYKEAEILYRKALEVLPDGAEARKGLEDVKQAQDPK